MKMTPSTGRVMTGRDQQPHDEEGYSCPVAREGVTMKDLHNAPGCSAKRGWGRRRVVRIWTDGAAPGGVASRVGTGRSRD